MKKAFNTAWTFLKNETYLQDMIDMGMDVSGERVDPHLLEQLGPIPNAEQLMNLQRTMQPHESQLLADYFATPRSHNPRVKPTPKNTYPLEEMESGEMKRMPNREERFGSIEKPMTNIPNYNRFLQGELEHQRMLHERRDPKSLAEKAKQDRLLNRDRLDYLDYLDPDDPELADVEHVGTFKHGKRID